MERQRVTTPLLNLAYFCHGKTVEDIRNPLLYTTIELEQTKVAVQEDLKKRDEQLIHLQGLLDKAIKERDDAQQKYQKLLFQKLLVQQQNAPPTSGISSIEEEPRQGGIGSNNGFSSTLDCDESIVSSPASKIPQPIFPRLPPETETTVLDHFRTQKPLPEKGKLLQAVMQAEPLLQTLLLAGPLPQWKHPPPPLDSIDIPPVTVTIPSPPPQVSLRQPEFVHQESVINSSGCNKKRVLSAFGDHLPPTESKYQRISLH